MITNSLKKIKEDLQYLFNAWKNDCYYSDYLMDMCALEDDIDNIINKTTKTKYVYHYHAKNHNTIVDGLVETFEPITNMDRYREVKRSIFT
jgi:hypothetical protein